jgi:hypothetical protein
MTKVYNEKQKKFILKLINNIKTLESMGDPIPGDIDEEILNVIGDEAISRKEIIEIFEYEKSNKSKKFNEETIHCLEEWAHGTFWDIKWENDFKEFA